MMRLDALRKTLLADLSTRTERGRLVRSAGATAGLKIGATLLAFAASLLYARVLGPHGYGLYAYVIAWVTVLSLPCGLGLPQYLVREGAKAGSGLRELRQWADRYVVLTGLLASILLVCVFFIPQAAGARWLFVVAAPLPLLNNLALIRTSLLQARGFVARSQWPLLIAGPALTLATLAGIWIWKRSLYPIEVIALVTGMAALPLFINSLQLRKYVPESENAPPLTAKLSSALPFLWLGGLYLINNRADIIMLGALRGAQETGIYAVVSRAAELVVFFHLAANMVIGPRITRLHHSHAQATLQRLLTAAIRRVFILTIPLALLFLITARPLLTYLYGFEYAKGAAALQILTAAQFINVAAGSTGTILTMTGYERHATYGVGLSVLLNILLNAILIPLYGIVGAAIATGVSLVAWNVLLWYWIRTRLHLRPSVLSI